MSHEIEADFVDEYANEATQCQRCTSFSIKDGYGFCSEGQCEVSPRAHCDFFQSVD